MTLFSFRFVFFPLTSSLRSARSRAALAPQVRKAVGQLVGLNRFSSAKEQWAMLSGAAGLAESLTGLGLVLGLDDAEPDDDASADSDAGGAPIDNAVLADAGRSPTLRFAVCLFSRSTAIFVMDVVFHAALF